MARLMGQTSMLITRQHGFRLLLTTSSLKMLGSMFRMPDAFLVQIAVSYLITVGQYSGAFALPPGALVWRPSREWVDCKWAA